MSDAFRPFDTDLDEGTALSILRTATDGAQGRFTGIRCVRLVDTAPEFAKSAGKPRVSNQALTGC